MADNEENKTQAEETSEDTQETQTTETSQSQPSISDDQVSSLKTSIAKDVEGSLADKVSKSVTEKIATALGLTKDEEEQLPKDAESLKRIVDEQVSQRLEEQNQQLEQEEQKTQQQRQQEINSIVTNWNQQYSRLAQQNPDIPKIEKAGDKSDAGEQAKRKIILHIGKMINDLRARGDNSIPSVHEALIDNPKLLEGVEGADLPISGNTASRENEESFKYQEDIAGKSFEQIVQGK